MSFPDVSGDFETFFEPTRIWLFGKPFKSLKYVPKDMGRWERKPEEPHNFRGDRDGVGEFSKYLTPDKGESLPIPPKRIERVLRRGLDVDALGKVELPEGEFAQIFARIYSFTYEAHYYRLPRPLLFLVRGEGDMVGGHRRPNRDVCPDSGGGDQDAGTTTTTSPNGGAEQRHKSRNGFLKTPFSVVYTGVEARDWDFSDDIRVWAVDRKDLAVCLDIEIGNYQEILLDSMLTYDRREEDRGTRSRGDLIGRGGGSFRGDMIGPHQNK